MTASENAHPVAVITSEDMLAHAPEGYDPKRPEWTRMVKERLGEHDEGGMRFTHPERPERLEAVLDSLRAAEVPGLDWFEAVPAERAAKARVHSDEHLEFLESYRDRSGWLHHDTTAVSEGSVHAADLAAGASCQAVDAVCGNDYTRSFALVRPPGHHAHSDRSTGFCLLNNAAIAVEHARSVYGVERVLVVDIDAHHGNGTQEIFRQEPDVMHVDFHVEPPCYPGSGALFETGTGPGFGTTVNVPLPAETGDAVVLEAVDAILRPRAIRFQPDLLVVSAGFDAHHSDLLMNMSAEGYAALTARLVALAELLTGGRTAWILEGGYRESLGACVPPCLGVLAGAPAPEIALGGEDPGREHLALAAGFHARPVYAAALAQAAALRDGGRLTAPGLAPKTGVTPTAGEAT